MKASARYRHNVLAALAELEAQRSTHPAYSGATAREIARQLVEPHDADSVQRVLRGLELDGQVGRRDKIRGRRGSYVYFTRNPEEP